QRRQSRARRRRGGSAEVRRPSPGQSTRSAIGSSSMMAVNTSSASGALTTRLGFSGAGAQGMISKLISSSGTEETVEAKEASAETESRSSSTRSEEVTASRKP